MDIPPSPIHELMLILSPDNVDRGTEEPFLSLFEKPLVTVIPPKYLLAGEENPLPNVNSVLLFEGGTDIDSALYMQPQGRHTQPPDTERDAHESNYFRLARLQGAACVGVCRGAQLLCALSGGSIIQDVMGHGATHFLELPDKYNRLSFQTTSAHHQVMNPYVLPNNLWTSYGSAPANVGSRYRDGNNNKVKVYKRWKGWKDQEIVWFNRTRSLAIQGHPEYFQSHEARFVQYCRFLMNFLILNPKPKAHEIQTP